LRAFSRENLTDGFLAARERHAQVRLGLAWTAVERDGGQAGDPVCDDDRVAAPTRLTCRSVLAEPPQFTFMFDDCRAWGVPAAPAWVLEPPRNRIPTLILSGSFDAITSFAWASPPCRCPSQDRANPGRGALRGRRFGMRPIGHGPVLRAAGPAPHGLRRRAEPARVRDASARKDRENGCRAARANGQAYDSCEESDCVWLRAKLGYAHGRADRLS
jgi:hypothetical protein